MLYLLHHSFSVSHTVPSQLPNVAVVTTNVSHIHPFFSIHTNCVNPSPLPAPPPRKKKIACTLKGVTRTVNEGTAYRGVKGGEAPRDLEQLEATTTLSPEGARWGSCVTETQRAVLPGKGPPGRECGFKEKEGNTMTQSCREFSVRNKYSSLFLLRYPNLLFLSPVGQA